MPYIPSKRTRCVLRQLQVRGTDTVADRWFGSTSPAKGNSNHMHSLVSDTVSLNLSTVSVAPHVYMCPRLFRQHMLLSLLYMLICGLITGMLAPQFHGDRANLEAGVGRRRWQILVRCVWLHRSCLALVLW